MQVPPADHRYLEAMRSLQPRRGGRWALAALVGCAASLGAAPAALAGTASISGTVKSDVAGAGFNLEIAGIEVTAYEAKAPNKSVEKAETSVSGEYVITGLSAGEYVVGFKRSFARALDFAPQFYPEKERFSEATHIVLAEGKNVGLGIAKLRQGASISGTVTDAGTHQPLSGILVYAISTVGEEVGAITETGSDGKYTAVGLPSGPSFMAFVSEVESSPGEEALGPYISQIYDEKPLLEGNSGLESLGLIGTPVELTAPGTVEINTAMVLRAPFNTVAPVASGTAAVGQLLTCANGTWTGAEAPSYAYKWLRDGAPIASATADTYAVVAADQGNDLVCEVSATSKLGGASALSNALAVPAAPVAPVGIPPLPPRLALSSSKLLVTATGAASVPLSCTSASCSGTIELTEQVSVKVHKGTKTTTRKQTLVLGKGTYSLTAGHNATIVVHLTAAARAALAKAAHHRLTAEVLATVTGGKTVKVAVVLSVAASKPK
jgi:hypothetical protein